MAKKGLFVLILMTVVVGGTFALPEFRFSIGGGGYLTGEMGGGIKASEYSIDYNYFGGGGFAFFDATFVELSLGFFGTGVFQIRDNENNYVDLNATGLDITLMGKYPFSIGDKFSLFPLLGINYRVMLSVKSGDELKVDSGDFNALWFNLGGGLDFSFSDNVFLRGELLYGLRLANKFEKDLIDEIDGASATFGHGPQLKIGIGYRF